MRTKSQFTNLLLKKDGQTRSANSRLGVSDSRLHEKQQLVYINALYGSLDGLSTSYSIIRCFFDALCANTDYSSTDRMHDWMMTPAGILAALTESIAIISISLIANVFDDDDKNEKNRLIALYWPYLRDAFKALKNTYRSIRGTLQVISILTLHDVRSLILPIGMAMGIVAMLNRALVRYTRAQRNSKVKANRDLLRTVQDSLTLSQSMCQKIRAQIEYEALHIRRLTFAAAIYSGLVDGIYLYMGMLSLAPLSPSIFILVVGLSVFFSLLCIASRVYEIYNEQRELQITQNQIKLALCGKELQALFIQLQCESRKELVSEEGQGKLVELEQLFHLKLREFEKKRARLQSTVTLSYLSSALAGMRGGLAAYGVIASLMFAVATVTTLMFTPFPPILVIAGVLAGLVCVLGFMAHSLIRNYWHEQTEKVYTPQLESKLSELVKIIQEASALQPTGIEVEAEARKRINEAMGINPSPQALYQEWFEVWRSLFSGLGKGQKSVDYTLFMLQQQDEQGHYHDTPFMYGVMAINSTVYGAVLAKRAYATYNRAANQQAARRQQVQETPASAPIAHQASPPSTASSFKNSFVFFGRSQKTVCQPRGDLFTEMALG